METMLLDEYSGKSLLASHGITIPQGFRATRPSQLDKAAMGFPVAVKAQVAAGGRGKAGGVVRADDLGAAKAAAERILGMSFGGEKCRAVLIEPWVPARRELYLAVAVDGNAGGYVVLYSPTGGVDIEQAGNLIRFPVGAPEDFRAHALRDVIAAVEEEASLREKILVLARRLIDIAAARDCTTIEINPLFLMPDGGLVAADAKVVRDDSAAWRQSDIAQRLEDETRAQPRAIRAALEGSLMLVWLEGEVGLISGGAGMTMAAMDLIAESGGRPACFLDCSANPTPDGYRLAFSLLDSEPRVKSILVAVFGGGTHVDRVARTMRDILKDRRSKKPVFFRLNGTNVEGVPAVFEPAGLHNHATLEEAVARAVAAAGAKR